MQEMITKKRVIDVGKIIEPHFYRLLYDQHSYVIMRGGRSSFKSSTVSVILTLKMLQGVSRSRKANIVCLRKTAATLRDSVYEKIQWAMRKVAVMHQFTTKLNPLRIVHIATGSTFYFYGQDDFEKLKSNDIGDVLAVWYEEASEFKNAEEFDQTNITFMRQKPDWADHTTFYWTYNPPRNPYSWINKWADSLVNEPEDLVDRSTYKNDQHGFLVADMLADIERVKRTDFDYYRYLYLGEAVGMCINVYNFPLFHQIDSLTDDDQLMGLYYGLDVGHEVSATTCVCVGLTTTRKIIVLDTYYYSPAGKSRKKSPSELAKEVAAFIHKNDKEWDTMRRSLVIDSAEGGLRNELINDYGISPTPVNKTDKLNMIDNVQTLLSQDRVFVLKKQPNVIFLEEHQSYHYDDKTLETANVRVVKEHDHTCDAFQYICLQNRNYFK